MEHIAARVLSPLFSYNIYIGNTPTAPRRAEQRARKEKKKSSTIHIFKEPTFNVASIIREKVTLAHPAGYSRLAIHTEKRQPFLCLNDPRTPF
jgi:uncharacterized metal-binding protein YceD (DUF177 family)